MKNFLRASTIGLAIAVSSAGVAFAQAGATDTSGRPTIDGLVAALNNYSTAITNLDGLTTVDANMITLINVADMVGGDNTSAYVTAMGNTDVAQVHTAISANATLANAITSANVDISDVVAVSVTPTGVITVYYIGD